MNRSSFSILAVSVAFALVASPVRLHSQGVDVPKTPLQMLTELKAANEALLQSQQKTLEKLELLKTQADQLRIFTKRS
jgi:hypothetical protein